ncbi:GDP-mannose 4,6-dehydratase [Geothrix sp. 21YS21S-2]|uniref:GDP-mannose 4,6-dehydratase n=1 Tax=Geothrix sp. 21YS21S-2 TaxID=3068893 RepID=UPI0027B9D3EC|nr:GDP-mannose 4,6-dehydratase [Geothrix sp. 21YS21S-2]
MPTSRSAMITGVTGQDGSYLAELLLSKGYQVHGMVRRSSAFNTSRIDHLHMGGKANPNFFLHYGDLADAGSLRDILDLAQPDEIYNLGGQSHVRVSFDQPEYTMEVNGTAVLRFLEALRFHLKHGGKAARFYQAGSSEMFGRAKPPQNEGTRFEPRSPYAVAKVAAHHEVVNYRESYGLFLCNGILFNHESPRRGENFVTRKITRAAARIKLGLEHRLTLGNLEPRRDWGFAGDYVEAMWRMLQQEEPDDYVIATGVSNSIRGFLDLAFATVGLDWHEFVDTDPRFLRPSEVDDIEGDASKARDLLGWKPTMDFASLVEMMVEADLELARTEIRTEG